MKKIIMLARNLLEILAGTAMGGIVVLVFTNVVMRYCFNTGLTWSDEVSVNLFVWFIFLGAILAALDGRHLKVDIFTNHLKGRYKNLCALIAAIFVALAMGILLVGGVKQVIVSHSNVSSATNLPFSYITVSMVFFALSMIGMTVYEMVKLLKACIQNKEADEK